MNSFTNKIKGKFAIIFAAAVLLVAVNYLVFSCLLTNRDNVSALEYVGNPSIGVNSYANDNLSLDKNLRLFSGIKEIKFTYFDQEKKHIYLAAIANDGNDMLVKFDQDNNKYLDQLVFGEQVIRSGVFDPAGNAAYFAVANKGNSKIAQEQIIKIDLDKFEMSDQIDMLAEEYGAIDYPFIDKINQFAYFIRSDSAETYLLRIDIGADNFSRDSFFKIAKANLNFANATGAVLDSNSQNSFVYLSNGQSIAKVNLQTLALESLIEAPDYVYKLLSIDKEAGYLYYMTKYSFKYSQLRRMDLNNFKFDSAILNLETTYDGQAMIIDKINSENKLAYLVLSQPLFEISNEKEKEDLSVFHSESDDKAGLQVQLIDLNNFSKKDVLSLQLNQGQFRTAMPDFENRELYLSISGSHNFIGRMDMDFYNGQRQTSIINLPSGEEKIISGFSDPILGFVYFIVQGHGPSVTKIVKVDAVKFQRISDLELAVNEKDVVFALHEPLTNHAYLATKNGVIIKIDLKNFIKIESIAIGANNISTAALDLGRQAIYFGNNSGTAQLHKVSISSNDFSYKGSLTTSLSGHKAMVIDTRYNFAYLADNAAEKGKILKVDLNDLSAVDIISTGDHKKFKSAFIDEKEQLAYFVSETDKIIAISIEPNNFKYQQSYNMPLEFIGSSKYVKDESSEQTLFYLVNNKIVKLSYGKEVRPHILETLVLPSSLAGIGGMIIDDGYGYIYLGSLENSNILRISYAPLKGKIKAFKTRLLKPGFELSHFEFYSYIASGNIRVALYDANKILLWQSPLIKNTADNNWLRINIPPKALQSLGSLPAGDYWLAWVTDSIENIASYSPGLYGQGFELPYKFGLFPKYIKNEVLNNELWSFYGVE